jgi:arsenate reductase
MGMGKARVLFLCTGNAARSQMAEAFLRKLAGDRFEVYSAGFDPQEIHPYVRKVMGEIGFTLEGHYSKGVGEFLGKLYFPYVIIVCEQANEKCPTIFPGFLYRMFWPFEDPAAFVGTEDEKLAKFREVRDQIEARLKQWLEELT